MVHFENESKNFLFNSDLKQKFNETIVVLQKMGINEASQEDCEIMKVVCACVSTRAAHLVSAGKYT